MDLLCSAAEDRAESVVQQCLKTIQSVVDKHWDRWGEGYEVMSECIAAASRAARNPHHAECSLLAIHVLRDCGKALTKSARGSGSSPGSKQGQMLVMCVTGCVFSGFSSFCTYIFGLISLRTKTTGKAVTDVQTLPFEQVFSFLGLEV